ncbi:MAG: DUF1634 domain-containing protein [Desulfobaccales bacterium]
MHAKKEKWTDQKVETIIGNILRDGVLIASFVILVGGIFFLTRYSGKIPHYRVFRGEPTDLRSIPGIFRDAFSLSSRGIIQLGLLLLMATPIARVAFSIVAFVIERDRMYVIITLIVLGILIYSLMGGIT